MLERDEYVEQAYLFRTLLDRLENNGSVQDLLQSIREELLSTTNLPKAVDFLAAELKLTGGLSEGMRRLGHYFTPFQAFVIGETERDGGRFDFRTGLEVLRLEAAFRGEGSTPQASFVYQFEAIARNRLGYDRGLEAMSRDPIYDADWREWILHVRREVGIVDFADLVYVRSAHYAQARRAQGLADEPEKPILFGEKEGRIAQAHRRKDPLLLFAALQRHLNYPKVPRPPRADENKHVLPLLVRRVERLEARLKLVEEEQRGGIDLSRFTGPASQETSGDGE
ncbi:MAG: hypothetical protein JNK76_04435 [Planctomycetales bacterium]|nr:hypothetical protein [Planctomycetales bacterium]MBN8627276.1 hypothetical protein [Planctomycetota bacterium]